MVSETRNIMLMLSFAFELPHFLCVHKWTKYILYPFQFTKPYIYSSPPHREREREMKPKAVVVGGSIAGVSCARTLILAGWDVVVLEKTCGPIKGSPTGAGLSLDPLAQRLIQSWLDDPELLHSSTLPLTIDMVLVLPNSSLFLFFPNDFALNCFIILLTMLHRLDPL